MTEMRTREKKYIVRLYSLLPIFVSLRLPTTWANNTHTHIIFPNDSSLSFFFRTYLKKTREREKKEKKIERLVLCVFAYYQVT